MTLRFPPLTKKKSQNKETLENDKKISQGRRSQHHLLDFSKFNTSTTKLPKKPMLLRYEMTTPEARRENGFPQRKT